MSGPWGRAAKGIPLLGGQAPSVSFSGLAVGGGSLDPSLTVPPVACVIADVPLPLSGPGWLTLIRHPPPGWTLPSLASPSPCPQPSPLIPPGS